jgi:hypothetical protein
MAYVEWYSPLKPHADHNTGMYRVKTLKPGSSGNTHCSIIPLTSIRQSCMLFPSFGEEVDPSWTSSNVLDSSHSFLLNNWRDLYTYKTVW